MIENGKTMIEVMAHCPDEYKSCLDKKRQWLLATLTTGGLKIPIDNQELTFFLLLGIYVYDIHVYDQTKKKVAFAEVNRSGINLHKGVESIYESKGLARLCTSLLCQQLASEGVAEMQGVIAVHNIPSLKSRLEMYDLIKGGYYHTVAKPYIFFGTIPATNLVEVISYIGDDIPRLRYPTTVEELLLPLSDIIERDMAYS